jgi:hypothetical protein
MYQVFQGATMDDAAISRDAGIFNEDRYFDVFVENAKEAPEDILNQRPQSRPGGRRDPRAADVVVPQPGGLARA